VIAEAEHIAGGANPWFVVTNVPGDPQELYEEVYCRRGELERHHIFAKNYRKSLGITETRDTNQIADCALVEWSDSIAISDSARRFTTRSTPTAARPRNST
jgi:hypothetical protein